ncbi:Ndufa9 [Bugula neritina]|uniref:Ndufa9 n=1 Tax=Bugula neritina TaxID=10212 RepID=A0A7J7K4Q5_BUGNE|nr:Ndufa9 [Bugula neritina]
MGDLTQLILFTPFYLQDEASIRKAMEYSNVVTNLAGREWETKLNAQVCETIFPATPPMTRDKLIREASSDILTGCPTLEDLEVKPSPLEPAARYLLKVHRDSPEYEDSLGEIDDAPPPPTVAEIEEAKKVYF